MSNITEHPTITIITPTYNRASNLKHLYETLTNQTVKDFMWLVVDDGSTDDTQQVVRAFIDDGKIDIKYMKSENGGKHRALNMGIAVIKSRLTFIVDSDDYLPEDAVDIILQYHRKYNDTPDLCGYSFLRCFEDGSVNTAYFKKDEEIASYRDIRINGNIGGDKAEVYFTDILKQFPFPEYEGEKFLPEDLVWMQMSGSYQMVHINKCIYIGEYLDDGLTKAGRAMKIHSPRGMMKRSEVFLAESDICLKVRVKMMMLLIIYGKFAGVSIKELFKKTKQKILFLLLVLPSVLIYLRWKKENEG